MFDVIPPQLLTGGGLAALVTLAVWLVFTGRLVPGSQVDRIVTAKDQQIAYLQEALATQTEVGRVQAGQVGELLEHARTLDKFIRALPRAGDREAA